MVGRRGSRARRVTAPGPVKSCAERLVAEALESRLLLSASHSASHKAVSLTQVQPAVTAAIPLNTSTWTAVGPAALANGSSGRLAAVAGDPNNPNVLYLAAAGGGVWKTVDGGASWTPLTDGQSTLFMGALAVAPSNPNVVYAGTGEATSSGLSFYGRGVLKSTDAGASWTLTGNSVFNRKTISQIAVDPTNSSTLYVAVGGGGVNGLGGNVGVFKSTDGGGNWTNTTASIGANGGYSDVEIDPANPQHLFCSLYNASAANGVYVTNNGGTSWALVSGGLPGGSSLGNTKIAIAPTNPQVMYVSFTSPSTSGLLSMWSSTNGGANWTQLTSAPNYMGSQGWYDSALIVDRHNANVVYAAGQAGGNSVIESTDGGQTWIDIHTGINGGGPHADHHGFGFDASGYLLDGNDGGIWKLNNSTPGSINWADLNANLQITQFIGGSLDPTNPNNAFAGSQDNGTEQFTGTLQWTVREGGDGGLARIDQQNPAIVYHQAPTGSLGANNFFRKSTDGGVTWAAAINGMIAGDSQFFYAPFYVDPNNGNHIFYGTNHLYESTNAAASWTAINTAGVNGWPNNTTAISTIAMAPSSPGTIYATVGGSLMATNNDGATWTPTNPLNTGNTVAQILVDPGNPSICYVVSTAFGLPHVLKTLDGGTTWSNISGNLPDLPTYSIALNPAANTIYVGGDNGVYSSTDGGATWSPYGFGMPNVEVRDLEFNANLGILAAITHGRGMYEISTALPTPIVVNTNVDETTSGDGLTSLREAVAQANVAGGTITFAASLIGGTISLTGGPLSISNGVVINGPGSRSLTIGAGGGSPLEIAGGAAVTIADVVVSGAGNVFQVDAAGQASLLDVTVGGNILDNGSLGFYQAINDTVSGSITGGGSLTKTGPQTLTLAGASSYTGGTTVTTGTLAGSTGSLNGGITVSNPGTLAFDQSGLPGATGSFNGSVSGTGTVRVLGPASTVQMGTTNGSTPSTFANSGPTVIDAGAALIASAANDLGSTSMFIIDGTLSLGGFGQTIGALSGGASGLVYNLSTQTVLAAVLVTGGNNAASEYDGLLKDVPPASGNGGKLALQKVGTGTLTLKRPAAAPDTYTGGTTVTAGALVGNTAAIEGSIADNSVLGFDQTLASIGDGVFAGSITGSGVFNVLAGIVRLAPGATLQNLGTSTITGTLVGPASGGTNALSSHSAYTVNGSLDLGASDQSIASLSGNGAVYHFQPDGQPASATLTLGNDNSGALFTGILEDTAPASGNGGILAVAKLGIGVVTLTGANTFTGGLTVLAGTLAVGPAPATADPLGAGTVTLNGGNLSLNGRITGATQQIVAATGYNQDVIAEAAAANALAATSTTFDGNFVWYEKGFAGSGTSGLPANGTSFTSAFNPAVTFQLQPYTSNNVAMIPGGNGSVTLTLATPAAYSTLDLLAAAANGMANLTATLHFADASSATILIAVSDWFNGSQAAVTANGRILRSTTSTVTLVSGNPRLYEYDLVIPIVDQVKPLTGITFNQTSGNQVGIYGLSGAASVVAASQSYSNDIQVLSPATIDVENSPTAGLGNMTIGAGAVARLQQNASPFVMNVSSLSIAAGGKLDLNNNTLFLNYGAGADPVLSVSGYLANGYNGGAWNGASGSGGVILSSAAASGPLNTFGVGYADSADGVVAGQPANSIEIRYTVMGDANLDRVVDSTDAILMARNYLVAGKTAWDLGNFNYDGTINYSDALILQKNFNATVTIAAASAPAVSPPALPAPPAAQNASPDSTAPISSPADPTTSDSSVTHKKPKQHQPKKWRCSAAGVGRN